VAGRIKAQEENSRGVYIMNKYFFRRLALLFLVILLIVPFFNRNQPILKAQDLRTQGIYTAATYNIHHGTTKWGIPSLQNIGLVLEQKNPDFIALQEVDRYQLRTGFEDQIKRISQQLNMQYVYGENIKKGVSEYGNAILTHYPILSSGKIDFHVNGEPRSILWAKVKTNHGNLYLTSIHLGTNPQVREQYFSKVEDFVHQIGNQPLLLMGDFNTLPRHPLVQQLNKMVTGTNSQKNTPTFYVKDKGVQIDYIIGRSIDDIQRDSIPSNASDHYPLFLQFRIADRFKI